MYVNGIVGANLRVRPACSPNCLLQTGRFTENPSLSESEFFLFLLMSTTDLRNKLINTSQPIRLLRKSVVLNEEPLNDGVFAGLCTTNGCSCFAPYIVYKRIKR
jgi:hypothetical protein